jgi:fumarate hydratase subunit beta
LSSLRVAAPLNREARLALRLGDTVFLDGEIVATAGYPTHERLVAGIARGEAPPMPLQGAAFFHLGSMCREVDGRLRPLYANPTTSTRFNAFMPTLLRHFGFSALAGKGGLDADCVAAMAETATVYFSMIGGGAPLLTDGLVEVVGTGWDDLIAQFRLTRFRVRGFGPLTVAIDAHGNSVYADLAAGARARSAEILRKPRQTTPGG